MKAWTSTRTGASAGLLVVLLRDCDGDHERAALKFLDFAAEFVASRRNEPTR